MKGELFGDAAFLCTLYEALPMPVLVVDDDVRIMLWNRAAEEMLGSDSAKIYRERGGDALGCLNSLGKPGGCGRGGACRTCIIRGAVGKVIAGGRVHREKALLERSSGGRIVHIHLLVTASILKQHAAPALALLMLEDVSELMQLQSLLPICAGCKKVRSDKGYWEDVAIYLKERLEFDITHSICPDCRARLYPQKK